ncbi:hypothetical protein PR202_ga31316 [Eleusine coracana subsp. coracana]|uniref:Uncharacterized protein n=1 Tax=Eleusine coracana subsp. coracana TaxID=191504 RepID=A0AAV5DSU6_ELECO|nr:hypothetical protein PR202_ga31316 [Eleusine coracana subsp. coracana]
MELLLRDSIPTVSLAVSVRASLASPRCSSRSSPRSHWPSPIATPPSSGASRASSSRGSPSSRSPSSPQAAGRGPLDPDLPIFPFIFTAALPVKLTRRASETSNKANQIIAVPRFVRGEGHRHCRPPPSLLVKGSIVTRKKIPVQKKFRRLHFYVCLPPYDVHMYCFLYLLLPCIAAADKVFRMDLELQFDRPYTVSSLRDFWGGRWNLMVSAVLRPSVYHPVHVRAPGSQLRS